MANAEFFDEIQAVSRQLEAGQDISVSSAYAYEPLPNGIYDGEYRTNAVKITKPDHVAVLVGPDEEGVCSVEQGCKLTK